MRIIIAGDYCPQNRVAELFEAGDYKMVLGDVAEIINKADFSLVNLECPVTRGGEKPIDKIGPNLCCSSKGIEALKWAGFKCVTLANNHFYDYGEAGVIETIKVLDGIGIDHTGGGINLTEASRVLYKDFPDARIAIINCCEHEFSIATDYSAGSNPLNPIRQYYCIREAKSSADLVIVIIHGGNEHYRLPSPRMQEAYRFFIDSGADVVINHHQHCFSGYEVYHDKPIFYGLGNFCFDNNKEGKPWNEGYMVDLCFNDKVLSFSVIPYRQCGEKPGIVLSDDKNQSFFRQIEDINRIISNPAEVKIRYKEFIASRNVGFIFEPYTNPLLLRLKRMHLLPSLVSKNKKKVLLSYIQCESHYDRVLSFLSEK